jgi:hypothetical protein
MVGLLRPWFKRIRDKRRGVGIGMMNWSYSRNGSLQIWWISKKCLEEYAGTFGVENKELWTWEKISQ